MDRIAFTSNLIDPTSTVIVIFNLKIKEIIMEFKAYGPMKVIDLEGGRLACSCIDASIKIFNYLSGEYLYSLRGHSHVIFDIILVNETVLASCSNDQSIIIWNVRSGRELQKMLDIGVPLSLALLSPIKLASAVLSSCRIKIWNLDTGRLIKILYGHFLSEPTLLYLGGNYFATGSEKQTIFIWNFKIDKKVKEINNGYMTKSLTLLRNGHLACKYELNQIKIWNYTTTQLVKTLNALRLTEFIDGFLLLNNGHLLTLDILGYLNIWYFSSSLNNTSKFIFLFFFSGTGTLYFILFKYIFIGNTIYSLNGILLKLIY
jgi:WD40 repeat protein